MSTGPAAFVGARLDEDEAAARAAADAAEQMSGEPFAPPAQAFGVTEVTVVRTHIARHDPARVLRDVAAGRAILARHAVKAEREQHHAGPEDIAAGKPLWWHEDVRSCVICGWFDASRGACETVCDLAAVWSDHPDYAAAMAAPTWDAGDPLPFRLAGPKPFEPGPVRYWVDARITDFSPATAGYWAAGPHGLAAGRLSAPPDEDRVTSGEAGQEQAPA